MAPGDTSPICDNMPYRTGLIGLRFYANKLHFFYIIQLCEEVLTIAGWGDPLPAEF